MALAYGEGLIRLNTIGHNRTVTIPDDKPTRKVFEFLADVTTGR